MAVVNERGTGGHTLRAFYRTDLSVDFGYDVPADFAHAFDFDDIDGSPGLNQQVYLASWLSPGAFAALRLNGPADVTRTPSR